MGLREPIALLGRDILSATPWQQRRWLDQAFSYWRAIGFPYPLLDKEDVEREFEKLQLVRPSDVLSRHRVHASTQGLRLANTFHPQMWSVPAHRHARAPLDHFEDDATLRKLLHRAMRFWPQRRCWNAQCIRSVFRIYAGGRVANFRPAAARAIIARYSTQGQTVLDFSAGFGGRLLGCLTLDRRYIGIDPARSQVAGLRKMLRALRALNISRASIVQACAEDLMPQLESASVDLVFSSPPYFNLEKYSRASSQSYQRYKTYDLWAQNFLRPVIQDSYRVLRPGGHMVINASNTREHAIAGDLEAIGGELFREHHLLKLLMRSRPMQRANGTGPYRWEPLLVFRKTT